MGRKTIHEIVVENGSARSIAHELTNVACAMNCLDLSYESKCYSIKMTVEEITEDEDDG